MGARVLVISLGGTVAMTGPASGGITPTLEAPELVRAVPGLGQVAAIDTRSLRQLPGAHLSIDDVLTLAREIADATRGGFTGIVVTQGTDTIEETAFALDLLLDLDAPVVVTGAMRAPSMAGADGPANLLDAVSVAASEQARGIGCLVVLGGKIHAARFVRKTHTANPDAFASVTGSIGWVIEGVPQVLLRPASRLHLPVPASSSVPAPVVALSIVSLGDDGRFLPAASGPGCDGLVVEALGAGHVPLAMVDRLEKLANLVPVVLCSRTGGGSVLAHTYGFAGSEKDLLARGLVSGGYLDGPKARVALILLLQAGSDKERVRELFRDAFGALS